MSALRFLPVALGILAAFLPSYDAWAQTTPAAPPVPVADGSVVHLEYTLTDEGGKVLDTNKGKDPLVFTHGRGQIIPGLEKALLGMKQGDTKHVTIPPEDAYGKPDPQAIVEVSKNQVPGDVTVGAQLVGRNQNGRQIRAIVKEVKEQAVVLDFNHPFAGKTLVFDVKVLSVTPAKAN